MLENSTVPRKLSLLAAAFLAGNVSAETTLTAKVGTLGLGIEGAYQLTPKWGIRGGFNQFDYDFEDDIDGIDYDGDLELSSFVLFGDYRPWASRFRLTGGVVFNGNEISAVADPAATYEIGDTIYTIEESGELSAGTEFDSIAPYIGLGWDFNLGERWTLSIDAGALLQGEASVTVNSVGGTLSNDPDFRAELDEEARLAEDDLDEFELYPVVSIGLGFKF